jgi:hypothetical protein
MSTDVNYSIKGTTDVPQQVDKSKKAMSDLERQTAAVQRKFTDFGKDLFMSFFAPMVLIHQAINFITSAIAQAKQDAKEAVDFAAGIKMEEMKTSPVDAATRYLAQRLKVEIRTEEEQKQAAKARQVVTEEFLKRDPRGREYYMKNVPISPETGAPVVSEFTMSLEKSTQDFVLGLAKIEAEKALKEEQAARGKPEGTNAQNIPILSSATVGVGMNAQFDILNKQMVLQEDMANSLRRIVEGDQGSTGFQPQKYPDFGGPTQSSRTLLPPR